MRADMRIPDDLELEWLILADAAQIVGGKLYLLGGGWDRFNANSIPTPINMAVAISIRVPWHRTNEVHEFGIDLQSEDGVSLAQVDGKFEVGRPLGVPSGQAQRVQLAVNIHATTPTAGGYVIIAELDGRERRRVPFVVYASKASIP